MQRERKRITRGRECNRHQVISQLEDLGVNHSSNLTEDGINDKETWEVQQWDSVRSTSHPAQHQHCVPQKLHPEPTSFKSHTDKVTHTGKLVAAVQYLQLRNGAWNTPCAEHNTSRSKLLEVAALNSRHQITAGLFLLWALHQLLSTCPVSLERAKHCEKRQENAK